MITSRMLLRFMCIIAKKISSINLEVRKRYMYVYFVYCVFIRQRENLAY